MNINDDEQKLSDYFFRSLTFAQHRTENLMKMSLFQLPLPSASKVAANRAEKNAKLGSSKKNMFHERTLNDPHLVVRCECEINNFDFRLTFQL